MVVCAAEDGLRLQANHVYTSPAEAIFVSGAVSSVCPSRRHPRRRFPVDHMFSSLALDQRERAIAIILSGTGTMARSG